MHFKNLFRNLALGLLLVCIRIPFASAFTAPTHEQITRAALHYIESRPGTPTGFARWLKKLSDEDKRWLYQVVIRAVVEPDFRPDIWGVVVGYGPVAGIEYKGRVIFFSSLLHFLNVTSPGTYWEHDGFSYRNFWGLENDQLLALPFSTIRADLSPPLGGIDPHGDLSIADPVVGRYDLGFRGDEKQWHHLFFDSGNAKRAVFPPSSVPAELGFRQFLESTRAPATNGWLWSRNIPVVSGVLKGKMIFRWFWRGEVQGLPQRFDSLGVALHMSQDLCIPQHTQGTIDFCHAETEGAVDALSCGPLQKQVDYLSYQDGSYHATLECQTLFDPSLVARYLDKAPPFQKNPQMTLTERMNKLAQITAHWQFGDPVNSVDPIGTVLPDGRVFTADQCSDLVNEPAIKAQLRLQFNVAVAATVTLLDLGADQYDERHLNPSSNPHE